MTELDQEVAIPEGATDFTDDGFRVTYYRRQKAFGMNVLDYWTGSQWRPAGYMPWHQLNPVER